MTEFPQALFTLTCSTGYGDEAAKLLDDACGGGFPKNFKAPSLDECCALLRKLHELHPIAKFTASAPDKYEVNISADGMIRVAMINFQRPEES